MRDSLDDNVMLSNAIIAKIINKFIEYLIIREYFKMIIIFVTNVMIYRQSIFIKLL